MKEKRVQVTGKVTQSVRICRFKTSEHKTSESWAEMKEATEIIPSFYRRGSNIPTTCLLLQRTKLIWFSKSNETLK